MQQRQKLSFVGAVVSLAVFSSCGGDITGGVTSNGFGGGGGFSSNNGGGTGGGAGGGSTNGSGLNCTLDTLLKTKCVSCHASSPTGGAPFAITSRADLMHASPTPGQSVAQRSLARMQDAQSLMPPSYAGPAATPAELSALQTWIGAGMPAQQCNGDSTGGGAGGGAGGGGSAGGTGGGAGGGVGGGAGGGGGARYCSACTATADCGPAGNFCIGATGGNFCGTDCSNGQTCPTNARCAAIVDANRNTIGHNCVPNQGLTCSNSGGGAGGGGGHAGGAGGGGGGGGSSCGTDTWASYGQTFFSQTCMTGCHHTGEFTTVTSVRNKLSSIKSRVNSGNMPPGGLSATAKTRIMSYLNCGAP